MSGTMRLTEMIRNLERERDEARAEVERLSNVLAGANDCIAEQEAHIEALQNTVAQVTAENERLLKHAGLLNRLNEKYTGQLDALQSYVTTLEDDAERLEWLVNPAHSITKDGSKYRTFIHRHIFMSDWYEDFRDAIDAAREKE